MPKRVRRMKNNLGVRLGELILFLSLLCVVALPASAAPIPTAGVYDETTTQTNNVDFNAVFSSGTGGATAANTTTASTGNGAVYSTVGPLTRIWPQLSMQILAEFGISIPSRPAIFPTRT